MKTTFLTFLIFFLVFSTISAQEGEQKKHPIDVAYDDCICAPDGNGYKTYGMIECAREAETAWDKELNKQYRELMKRLSADEKAKLKKTQKAWLAYRDAEKDFSAMYYGGKEGSMYFVLNAARLMGIIRSRALELEDYMSDE